MKIPADVVDAMRQRIAPLDTPEVRENYRTGNFPRADRVNNLEMRYRWDLFWAARAREVLGNGGEYNDAHIDTALRAIVPPLADERGTN